MDAGCMLLVVMGILLIAFFGGEMCDNVVVRRLMTRICRAAMPGRVHNF